MIDYLLLNPFIAVVQISNPHKVCLVVIDGDHQFLSQGTYITTLVAVLRDGDIGWVLELPIAIRDHCGKSCFKLAMIGFKTATCVAL